METGVLIRDVLKMKPLENSKILAGEAGLDRVVTRVNVMADPDVLNFVDEGEFLLTTSYFFKTTQLEEQLNLIRECHAKKLSGIGIKVRPHLERLPDEIIDFANRMSFPIVELDYTISFTEIMTPVFQEIFERQSNVLRKVENLHKDTMNVALKGGGLKDILKCLEKSLENPIVVKDHHFDEHITDELHEQKYYMAIEESLNNVFKSGTAYRYSKTVQDIVNVDGEDYDRIMVPIVVKNNVYGHVVTYGFKRPLTQFDTLYLESSSNVIALEFLKRISIQEVENKYRAEFFEDLISLDEKRKAKAIERANYYRFDKDACYNIMSLRLMKQDTSVYGDEELNQTLAKVTYAIDLICRNEGKTYLVANKGRLVNVLLMWKNPEDHKKSSKKLIEHMKEHIDAKIGSMHYKMGLGRVYTGLENAHKSLKDAEKAVEASISYVDSQIIDFDHLGIYKIFCQDNLKDELISFYRTTLEPLVIYDRKRDTELVKSLVIYFETNGNLKKMSELLFTHYNTVLYRINRIQEITNKNLEDERDRYGLQTALKIMQILDL